MAQDGERVEVEFGAQIDDLQTGIDDAAKAIEDGAKQMSEGIQPAEVAVVALGVALEKLAEYALHKLTEALHEAAFAYGELGEAIEHMQHRLGGSAEDLSALKAGLESLGISTSSFESIARRLPMVLEKNGEKMQAAGVAYKDADGKLLPMQDTIQNIVGHLNQFTAGSERNAEGVKLLGRSFMQYLDLVEMTPERMEEARKVAEQFGMTLGQSDVEATHEFHRQLNLLHTAVEGFTVIIGKQLTPIMTALAEETRDNLAPAFAWVKSVVEDTMWIDLFITGMDTVREVLGVVLIAVKDFGSLVKAAFEIIVKVINDAFGRSSTTMTNFELFHNMIKVVQLALVGFRTGFAIAMAGISTSVALAANAIKMFIEVAQALATPFDKAKTVSAAWEKWKDENVRIAQDGAKKMAQAGLDGRAAMDGIILAPPSIREKGGIENAGGKSSPASNKDASGIAEAQAAYERAIAQAALMVQREAIKEAQAANETERAHDLISLQDYYDSKLALERASIQASIAAKRAEIVATEKSAADVAASSEKKETKEKDALKYKAQLAKLTADLTVLEMQETEAVITNRQEAADAIAARLTGLDLVYAAQEKATGESQISLEQSKIKQLQDLRQIDAQTAYEMQLALEEKSYALVVDYNNRKLQDDLKTSKDTAKTYADAQAIELQTAQQHEQRLTDIHHQAELDRQRYSLQTQQSIQSAFAQMTFDMMDGVKKWTDLLKNFALAVTHAFMNVISQRLAERIFGSGTTMNKLIDEFVDTIISGLDRVLHAFITNEAAKNLAVKEGVVVRTAAEQGGFLSGLASQALAIIKSIMNYAAQAFAGVWAALSGIPFIGPALAAAEAPMAFGVVAGIAGTVASSAGGDWKVGSDRLNMVHQNETILPANISEKMRNFFEHGGSGGGVTFNVTAVDAAGVKRFFMDNGHHIAHAMKQQARGFTPVKVYDGLLRK